MKISESFYFRIFLAVIITLIIGIYPVLRFCSPPMITGILCGTIMSILNVLIGYSLIEYSINKPNRVFFKAIIGGLIIRLFFIGIVLVLLVKVFLVDTIGLITSLFIYYFLFLGIEILYLNKRLLKRNIKPVS